MLLVCLPQDVELLLPIAEKLRRTGRLLPHFCVSRQALRHYPWIAKALAAFGHVPSVSDERLLKRGLHPLPLLYRAIVSPSESSAPPHHVAHGYMRTANILSVPTFTLQHGLENIGLTYQDDEYGDVTFAAQTLLTWSEPDTLPAFVAPETRSKCIATGRPRMLMARAADAPASLEAPYILVTENLHWARYTDAYRQAFCALVQRCARNLPNHRIVVHPHPAGQWAWRHHDEVTRERNVCILPEAPTAHTPTLAQLLSGAELVLSTPSTTVVDAALAEVPVVVFAHDLSLPAYEPVPLLRHPEELDRVLDSLESASALTQQFLARAIVPGDGSDKIVECLNDTLGQEGAV